MAIRADSMNSKNAALGERIRQARKTLGLTQQEFAAQLEVTQPTVHRWEKGFYDPDEEALQRLAGMTKMSPAYFRYGEHDAFGGTASVAVTGHVGLDGEVHPAARGHERIDAPPCQTALAAIQVRGDGLRPAYDNGDIIFYAIDANWAPGDIVGRDCIVKLTSGLTLLKRVTNGARRDRYTLSSHVTPPIDDVELAWASPVRWVRRG